MNKDYKILIVSVVASFLLVVGLAAIFNRNEENDKDKFVAGTQASGIEASPEAYDLGDVDINGGLVTKEYEIKNISGQVLKLKKIATSCMCTEAKVSLGERETKFFGMEHGMDKNPPVSFEIPPGETAKVTVRFNPAAHGPQGVGPFERMIWLTFSDPAGIKELKFSGTVVN